MSQIVLLMMLFVACLPLSWGQTADGKERRVNTLNEMVVTGPQLMRPTVAFIPRLEVVDDQELAKTVRNQVSEMFAHGQIDAASVTGAIDDYAAAVKATKEAWEAQLDELVPLREEFDHWKRVKGNVEDMARFTDPTEHQVMLDAIETERRAMLVEVQDRHEAILNRLSAEEDDTRLALLTALEPLASESPEVAMFLASLQLDQAEHQYLDDSEAYWRLVDSGEVEELAVPLADYAAVFKTLALPSLQKPKSRYRVETRYLLASCHLDPNSIQYDQDLAYTWLLKIARQDPDHAITGSVEFQLGEIDFDRQRFPQATKHYDQALDVCKTEEQGTASPLCKHARYKLGWSYEASANSDRAIYEFAKLLLSDRADSAGNDADEVSLEALTMVAQILQNRADRDRTSAVQASDAFFAAAPDFAPLEHEVLNVLDSLLAQNVRYDDRIAVIERLLERYPLALDSPEHANDLIGAHLRRSPPDLDAAALACADMTYRYDVGTPWWKSVQQNPHALASATTNVERCLHHIGTSWHAQANEFVDRGDLNGAQQAFQQAIQAYIQFLERFPLAPMAYQTHYYLAVCLFNSGEWDRAAQMYGGLERYAETEFAGPAAQDRALALERVLQREHPSVTVPSKAEFLELLLPAALSPPVELDDAQQRFVDAVELLAINLPGSPELPRLRSLVATLYLTTQHPADERQMWYLILEEYPDSDFAMVAAVRLMESYARAGDTENVANLCEALRRAQQLGTDAHALEEFWGWLGEQCR